MTGMNQFIKLLILTSRMTHPKMIKHIKLKDNLAILEQLLPETTIVRLLVAKINILKQMRV